MLTRDEIKLLQAGNVPKSKELMDAYVQELCNMALAHLEDQGKNIRLVADYEDIRALLKAEMEVSAARKSVSEKAEAERDSSLARVKEMETTIAVMRVAEAGQREGYRRTIKDIVAERDLAEPDEWEPQTLVWLLHGDESQGVIEKFGESDFSWATPDARGEAKSLQEAITAATAAMKESNVIVEDDND